MQKFETQKEQYIKAGTEGLSDPTQLAEKWESIKEQQTVETLTFFEIACYTEVKKVECQVQKMFVLGACEKHELPEKFMNFKRSLKLKTSGIAKARHAY